MKNLKEFISESINSLTAEFKYKSEYTDSKSQCHLHIDNAANRWFVILSYGDYGPVDFYLPKSCDFMEVGSENVNGEWCIGWREDADCMDEETFKNKMSMTEDEAKETFNKYKANNCALCKDVIDEYEVEG